MAVSPCVRLRKPGWISVRLSPALPPGPNITTSGITTSASSMITPCTKSVRLTARNPPTIV